MRTEVTSEQETSSYGGGSFAFAWRVLIATLVVAAVVFVLYLVWYAADLLMLVFAGLMVSILLRGFTRFLMDRTGIGRGPALAIVALSMLALIVAGAWLVTGRIGQQISDLWQKLPLAVENVRQYFSQYDWARSTIDSLPNLGEWLASRGGSIVSRLTGLASTTAGVAVNTVVVVIIGLYLASQPGLYSRGIKHLLPFRYRKRADEVMRTIDEALHRWIVGRFILMAINGALTTAGLWALGVPLALPLGLLAGALNFIPNIGPWIAAIPAILIAFLQGPQQALYVALLYLALQSADGYILTPLVDRESVELPPVVTITAQVILGLAFGFLGLLLASPLAAVVMIAIRKLYIEDILGDHTIRSSGESEKKEPREKPAREAGDG